MAVYYGRNILREAFAAKAVVSEIYYDTEPAKKFAESLNAVKSQKIPLKNGIPNEFKHQSHQGIAFKTAHEFYIPYSSEALKKFPFIILCNKVEDVHNLGSIARCAAGFGAKLIIHEEKNSAELTAAAIKSSSGLAFRLSFMKIPSLSTAAKDLTSLGFHLVGLDVAKNSVSLFDWIPNFPLALVLGSEGEGIEPAVKARCEALVKIPTEAWVESLNVSHAAAVAMSWAYRSNSFNRS
jgi:23S rRNA (guanosine2251-2'-O)-methyltransferase